MAGTGKSTIARTIADSFAEQKKLGASFFLSRGEADLGNAKMFFSTIASRLANKEPSLRKHISKAISKNPQIVNGGLAEQWEHLLLNPLKDWEHELFQHNPETFKPQTLVLVIDALDECDDENKIRLLVRLLAKSKELQKIRVRVFITSRPEQPIRLGFKNIDGDAHRDYALHDIDKGITQQDIFLFLLHKLEEIREDYEIEQGWPAGTVIQALAQKANGLFIYAATACRFLQNPKAETQLELLLDENTYSESLDAVVDGIYSQVLTYSLTEKSGHKKRAETAESFREVVGPIVILFDPLSYTSLAELIELRPQSVRNILDHLHSVLDIPASQDHPIRLLHPSFREFLLDPTRSSDSGFCVDEKATQKHIFLKCIRLMSMHLKRYMCELGLPAALAGKVDKTCVNKHIPTPLQYACRYWVNHLIEVDTNDNDLGEVFRFLQKKLLYWLEALSLIGKVFDCVQMVTTLESFIVSAPKIYALAQY